MSDAFYNLLWHVGLPAFWVSSRPTVLNAGVTRRAGAYILAANHQSPYDIPILMRHCARNIDFVSIVEVFRNPLVARLYGSMNAFPLDRARPDSPTVREIMKRLDAGRVIGFFPEGGFRHGEASVLIGGPIRTGIGRLSKLANVPIIPCTIVGTGAYSKFTSWLPLRHTRYGVAFGEPIEPTSSAEAIETNLVATIQNLHGELREKMSKSIA